MTKACPKCNQPNPAEAAFCLNCASSLGQTAEPPFIGQQQNQQRGQQQWPGANVGAPVVGGYSAPGTTGGTSQKGVAALVLAIIALLCCGPITGVPAAILGWMELDAIKNGRSPQDGKWMGMVGLWGGIISSILHVIFYVLWVLLSAMSAASNPYGY